MKRLRHGKITWQCVRYRIETLKTSQNRKKKHLHSENHVLNCFAPSEWPKSLALFELFRKACFKLKTSRCVRFWNYIKQYGRFWITILETFQNLEKKVHLKNHVMNHDTQRKRKFLRVSCLSKQPDLKWKLQCIEFWTEDLKTSQILNYNF